MYWGRTRRSDGDRVADAETDGADVPLIALCEDFIRHADARTIEGDRLDRLPWSDALNAGYLELNRDTKDHNAMLEAILAMTPRTTAGLVAKARVINRHQHDEDAAPIPATILATDVLRLCQTVVDVVTPDD